MFKMHHKNLRVHFFQAESEESMTRYVLYFIFILLASPKEQTKKPYNVIKLKRGGGGGRQGHRNRIKRVSPRARETRVSPSRVRSLFAHYFQAPATQAKKECEMLRLTKYKKRD